MPLQSEPRKTAIYSRPQIVPIIAGTGLLVGTLDLADALIFFGLRGVSATRILQGIASGALGRDAFTQGMRSTLLGLFFHLLIAYTVTALYLLAALWLPLYRHPFLYGTLYGLVIYVVMNYIVLPASHIGLRPTPPLVPLINGIAALIVCIGIPLGYIARHYLQHPST